MPAASLPQTSGGYVTFRMHRVFDVHGAFQSRHEDLVMDGLYADGVLVRVRVVSYSINAKLASAAEISRVEESWNHPKAGDVFAAPFDPRNFAAYQYRSNGATAIGFTSSVDNGGHGSGSFDYDTQGRRGDVRLCA